MLTAKCKPSPPPNTLTPDEVPFEPVLKNQWMTMWLLMQYQMRKILLGEQKRCSKYRLIKIGKKKLALWIKIKRCKKFYFYLSYHPL
jgi:hypothetical protein